MIDLKYTTEFEEKLIAYRRDFHKYPEPAWLEYRTTVKIIEALEGMGLNPKWGRCLHTPDLMMGKPDAKKEAACRERAIAETGRADLITEMSGGFTGVVVEIQGELPGPTIAVRVDIDSNDLNESADSDHRPAREGFASVHSGAMHGCGHDGHTSIGLGTVELILANRDILKGKVIIIFQPAEEGGRGACSLVGSGLFEGVDYFFGGHIASSSLGTVSASTYGFLSGVKFDTKFKGFAVHAGGHPELGHNALAAASNAILNMLAIPRTSKGSSRINIGKIYGGTGRNVIPDEVLLWAEVRGSNSEISEYMFENAMRVCKAAADMYQCEVSHEITGKSENAVCDMDFASQIASSAKTVDGIETVLPEMNIGGGENITFMMNDVKRRGGKTSFLLIGGDITAPHHTRKFDFDEKVLPLAARLYAKIIFDLCELWKSEG